MTARLLVAAAVLVALATQPRAFDLLALKRAALLLAMVPLLFTREMGTLFVRSVSGPLRWLVWALLASGPIAVLGHGFCDAFSRGQSPALQVVLQAMSELAAFTLIALLVREVAWERATTLVRGLVILGALLGVVALLQVCGLDLIYGEASARVAVATFGNANAFSAWMAPVLALAVGLATRRNGGAAARLAVVLVAAALVVARGRGGWLAAAVGGACALVVAARGGHAWRRGALPLALGIVLGIGGALATGASSEGGAKPLGLGLERSSNLIRLDVARATLDLIETAPWIGHGPASFRNEYPLHRLEKEAQTPTREGAASEVDHPHDEWLRLAADHGALVALLVALAWLAALFVAVRVPKIAREDDGGLRAAAIGALAAWWVGSLTWSTLYDPATAVQGAILLGIAVAGSPEIETAAPRGRWLALPMRVVFALGFAWLALPTAAAEFIEWESTRDGSSDVATLRQAAELDAGNVERQYAIGTRLLNAAREQRDAAALTLPLAQECFERAIKLFPRHVASLAGAAEVRARRGDAGAARRWLARLRTLEPWRASPQKALIAQTEALVVEGELRIAVQLYAALTAATPEDGALLRAFALSLEAIGDAPGFRRAYADAQVAFALPALADGRSDEGRSYLDFARRKLAELAAAADTNGAPDIATTAALAEIELLDALVDLQKNRPAEAAARLAGLEPAPVAAARAGATPTAKKLIRMMGAAPALVDEARRLKLNQ
ncbi:MAG: hypothetical protein EXS13_13080 [Planctomycetes bacterium]|nr:hypothetical protein [Planctomycetota bacterium]